MICNVLIVKCGNKKAAPYANMLCQLITAGGKYSASSPISDDDYRKSYLTLDNTPDSHIIFIGDGKEIKIQSKAICWKYDNYGMKFGWLGKRFVATVDTKELLNGNVREFIRYYNSEIRQMRSLCENLKRIDTKEGPYYGKEAGEVANEVLGFPVRLVKGAVGGFAGTLTSLLDGYVDNIVKAAEKIGDAFAAGELYKRQYELLICELLKQEAGFQSFMTTSKEDFCKNVIIVYDHKNAKYAHLLQGLIQQYKGHSVAEYEQQYFMDNEKELAAENKVIFLGDSKAYKDHWVDNIPLEHNVFGMQCGWFVNQAFINIRTLKACERKPFIEHYRECYDKYEVVAKTYVLNNGHKALDIAKAVGIYNAPGIIRWGLPQIVAGAALFGAVKGVDKLAAHIKNVVDIKDYQYQLLIRDFVYKHFDKFVGGNNI